MIFTPVPTFAESYPERAETLAHTRLPFYCINCQRKAETTYLTPDFGPFCRGCLNEIESLLKEQENYDIIIPATSSGVAWTLEEDMRLRLEIGKLVTRFKGRSLAAITTRIALRAPGWRPERE